MNSNKEMTNKELNNQQIKINLSMKSNMKKVGGTSNIKTIFLKMTFSNL